MKILMLFPYAPLPPPLDLAGTKRNLPFLLELAKSNQVSVLSFGTPEHQALFSSRYGESFSEIRFVDPGIPRWRNGLERLWLLTTLRSPYRQLYRQAMQKALDELAAATRFDLVHCCVPMFGYYRFPASVPITSDTHEVKFELLRRTARYETNVLSKAYHRWSSSLGRAEEPLLWKKFDGLIATTDVDKRVMLSCESSLEPVVIQNGAGDEFFRSEDGPEEPQALVFTGLFTHPPNVQAVTYFLDEVFPLIRRQAPNAKIYVVGKSPPAKIARRANANIVVTGYVDDVRPYIRRAQVFVIPLLSGGGIRGKALEAMAMRKAIVTTTVGVEGIELRHGESAIFADSPGPFAAAVLDLFSNEGLRARLASAAWRVALERYTWAAKGRELERFLRAVVAAASSKSRATRQVV